MESQASFLAMGVHTVMDRPAPGARGLFCLAARSLCLSAEIINSGLTGTSYGGECLATGMRANSVGAHRSITKLIAIKPPDSHVIAPCWLCTGQRVTETNILDLKASLSRYHSFGRQ